MNISQLTTILGFLPKENTSGIYTKKYPNADNYAIEIDIEKQIIDYGEKIQCESKSTQNFSQVENFVVLECVNRLLEKGYKPSTIILEKTFPLGHNSGRLDILVTRECGMAYLMIECKTYGKEFDKAFNRLKKDGGQLFTYFQQDKNADVLMLYASDLKSGKIEYKSEIIHIEEDYRQTNNVKDFYDRWNKLPVSNGIFEEWVRPYCFESKALTPENLKEIKSEDSSFIFNRFLEILRHNVVSDKPNAFNKIFTLFLCKILDEKNTKPNEELAFQWFYTPYQYEGINYPPDNHISFQKRLTDLYRKGMKAFLDKEVTDISDADFSRKYDTIHEDIRKRILDDLTEVRLKKNNEFAIKEVFDDDSFDENAKVVKEVVELLQRYKIRYASKQQYLSDFFELLLTTGLKQESGQFFTPVPVAQFIIKSLPIDKILHDKLKKGVKDEFLPHIIDYASGSGHFITEGMHEVQRLLKNYNDDNFFGEAQKFVKKAQDYPYDWAYDYIYGIEKDYRLVKVGKVGCYLHGDGLAKVIHSDGLGSFTKTKDYKGILTKTDKDFPQENKQFDILVSNPPYSVSAFKNNATKFYGEEDFELYNNLTDNSSEIECLFVERTKQLLKDGGVAGVILPKSILEKSGIYTRTREIILQNFEIVAITELGSNAFMATGVNTVVLFLKRRNNYDSINLKQFVERFFNDLRDVNPPNPFNIVEKPVAKYVAHVWESLNLDDYISLLKKEPNSVVCSHEIYKEYRKKIKAKTEKDFLNALIETEKEKLLYFILAYPQKIVLVKTGEKDEEKHFLGYKFSDRRETQGIFPMQIGKTIEECTQLFDAENFENPQKASNYIYQAFSGNFDLLISDNLKNNVSYCELVQLFTFNNANFEKDLSLTFKEKVEFETKLNKKRLGDIFVKIENGKRPKGGVAQYRSGVPSLGGEHIGLDGKMNYSKMKFVPEEYFQSAQQGILEDLDILLCKDGALTGKVALFKKIDFQYPKGMINEHVFALKTDNETTQKYVFYVLYSMQGQRILKANVTGTAQGGLNRKNLESIQIPFPKIDIQQKIVSEIELLEEKAKTIVVSDFDGEVEKILNKYLQ